MDFVTIIYRHKKWRLSMAFSQTQINHLAYEGLQRLIGDYLRIYPEATQDEIMSYVRTQYPVT